MNKQGKVVYSTTQTPRITLVEEINKLYLLFLKRNNKDELKKGIGTIKQRNPVLAKLEREIYLLMKKVKSGKVSLDIPDSEIFRFKKQYTEIFCCGNINTELRFSFDKAVNFALDNY